MILDSQHCLDPYCAKTVTKYRKNPANQSVFIVWDFHMSGYGSQVTFSASLWELRC